MFIILYNTLAKIAKYFFRTYISSVIYFAYNMIPLFMFFHSEYSLIAPWQIWPKRFYMQRYSVRTIVKHRYANGSWIFYGSLPQIKD